MKILFLFLLVLGFVYRLALNIVQYRSARNPIPENVSDVYDAETYGKWRRYSAEHCRLNILSTVLSFLVSLVLLVTNAYAAFASPFGANMFLQLLVVVLLESLVDILVIVPIGYYETMVTALKKLARENFSHLAPSPIFVVLEYSHPPLSQRIARVQQEK